MTGKVLAAAAAAAVALLAAGSARPEPAALRAETPLLGLLADGDYYHQALVRVDPTTVRALPGPRVSLGYTYFGSFSPDRTVLAFGRVDSQTDGTHDPNAYVRIVDVQAMRAVRDLALGAGSVLDVAWLAPGRVVVVVSHCCGVGDELVIVDPGDGRPVDRQSLGADPVGLVRTPDRLVLLLGAQGTIGAARLLDVGADGAVSSVTLDRIAAGSEREGAGGEPGARYVFPALAVDAGADRAFVLSPQDLVAEVDLRSGAVAYHSVSPLGRRLQGPAAPAKLFYGASRWAQWLGNGRLAVAGADVMPFRNKLGERQVRHRPSGLELIDTLKWTARTIDRNADSFTVAGSYLLATGSRWTTPTALPKGSGLTGYTSRGRRRFRLLRGRVVALDEAYGTRAFVEVDQQVDPKVIDLRRGRVVGARGFEKLPRLLVGDGSSTSG